MAIFLVYSISGITSGKKVCRELKMAAILKILKYKTQLQFDLRYKKIVPNYAKKVFYMMITSSMTSQGGLKVGSLYPFINEITTFFMITKKWAITTFFMICLSRCIINVVPGPLVYVMVYCGHEWTEGQMTVALRIPSLLHEMFYCYMFTVYCLSGAMWQ